MARKSHRQHRRSISLTGETYDKLKAYCEANGISMSRMVEARVNEAIDRTTQHEDLMSLDTQCSRCGRLNSPRCCDQAPRWP